MSEDKELLELAAKAAGIWLEWGGERWMPPYQHWSPLTNDGDALRLAVKVGIMADEGYSAIFCSALDKADPYAATRRAIVKAAAEIGRSMG